MDNPGGNEPIKQIVYLPQRNPKDRQNFFNASDETARRHRIWFTIAVRITLIVVQLFFNVGDYSTDAFKGVPLEKPTRLDWFVRRCLQGFTRWDAAHMLHIAHYGYYMERSLAFFPLFPMFVRYLSLFGFPLTSLGLLHVSSLHIITAVVLNFIFFYCAAECLYDCVLVITHSTKQAQIASILFAINPASIFFTTAYSESFYCFITLLGIRSIVNSEDNFLAGYFGSLLCFAMSALTRANGLINFGYVGFYCTLNALFVRENGNTRMLVFHKGFITIISKMFLLIIQLAFGLICIFAPVYVYGKGQQNIFCDPNYTSRIPDVIFNITKAEDVLAGDVAHISWCNYSNIPYPAFYEHVQEKYWDVKWFGYWQMQKIPNFLLAAPAFLIIIYGIKQLCNDLRRKDFMQYLVDGGEMIPFTLHAIILGAAALVYYNVEVLTRMLFSSSLFPYLVVSRWMTVGTSLVKLSDLFVPSYMPFIGYFIGRGLTEKIVCFYFIGYLCIGSIVHIMGLPFT